MYLTNAQMYYSTVSMFYMNLLFYMQLFINAKSIPHNFKTLNNYGLQQPQQNNIAAYNCLYFT